MLKDVDYCMIPCDNKGDIVRLFNYFKLVYGHNPHQRIFNVRPDYLSTDKSYRKGMRW